jgi:hypothetical protein
MTYCSICSKGLPDGTCVFYECHQISDELLGALPVHHMAGLRVDLQGGIGDRRHETLLFLAREEGILLPHKTNVGTLISPSWTT